MSFDSMLNHMCTIQAPDRTPDGYGGFIEKWLDVYTGVPCSVDEISAIEHTVHQRIGVDTDHYLYMRPQPQVEETWRFVMEDGREFERGVNVEGDCVGIRDVGGRGRIWIVEVRRTT
jgi:head-tail adaptor